MPQRSHGFTLIEALIALAITVVLLTIAVPAWSGAAAAAHGSAARGQLAMTLLEAVSHSALAGVEVVVCPDVASLSCNGSLDWSDGWMAFADRNGNRSRDPDEPILHKATPLDPDVRLQSTVGRTRLVFQPNGGNAGSNVTFTLCDRRGAAKATTLVLANDGRLRSGTPTAIAAATCVSALR